METDEQRTLLENMGCTDAQGYLFSTPVPLEDFQQFLARASSNVAKRANH